MTREVKIVFDIKDVKDKYKPIRTDRKYYDTNETYQANMKYQAHRDSSEQSLMDLATGSFNSGFKAVKAAIKSTLDELVTETAKEIEKELSCLNR